MATDGAVANDGRRGAGQACRSTFRAARSPTCIGMDYLIVWAAVNLKGRSPHPPGRDYEAIRATGLGRRQRGGIGGPGTSAMNDVTRILSAIEHGDPRASEELLPLVYRELRRLAQQRLAREKPGQTLQATALVPEGYPRLVDA